MDETVSAMLINNPSNPCGSVYSRQHLLDVLKVAEKHHVPIISDDIYQDMVRIFYRAIQRIASWLSGCTYKILWA